jgi:hypothetical protein
LHEVQDAKLICSQPLTEILYDIMNVITRGGVFSAPHSVIRAMVAGVTPLGR